MTWVMAKWGTDCHKKVPRSVREMSGNFTLLVTGHPGLSQHNDFVVRKLASCMTQW